MGASDPGRTPEASSSLLRSNSALACISNAAWFIANPFIPLYLVAQGASLALVGVIIGTSGVLPLLISIHAGALVDERGPTATVKASVVLYVLAGAILAGLHGVWAVAVAYTLMGIANIGFAVAPQAIIAAVSDSASRVRNYGYYFFWNSVGAVAGPVIGGFAAGRYGYTAAFTLVWVLMLPSFAVAASLRGVPAAPRRPVSLAAAHTLAGPIMRRPAVGAILFVSFMVMAGQTLKQSFLPLYLHKVGLSATLIGIVFAADSLSSMLVRSLLARGVARFGYAALLLGAMGLAAFALGITPLLRWFWPLAIVSALMGASTGFAMPLTMTLMVESVEAEFWGVAIGIRQFVQRLGSVTGPIVFGLVTRAAGIESAFFLGALVLAGAVPITARVTRHFWRPEEEAAGLPEPPAGLAGEVDRRGAPRAPDSGSE